MCDVSSRCWNSKLVWVSSIQRSLPMNSLHMKIQIVTTSRPIWRNASMRWGWTHTDWLDSDTGMTMPSQFYWPTQCPRFKILGISTVHAMPLWKTLLEYSSVLEAIGRRDVPVYPDLVNILSTCGICAIQFTASLGLRWDHGLTTAVARPQQPGTGTIAECTLHYHLILANHGSSQAGALSQCCLTVFVYILS